MITAAALLVLVALGLFVWGIATGATALYWACVAVSAVAAVLLVIAFVRMRRTAAQHLEPATRGLEPAAEARDTPAGTTGAGEPGHAGAYAPAGPGSSAADTDDAGPAGPVSPPPASPPPPASGATTAELAGALAADPPGADGDEDPAVEEVEVTDLLLVVDLHDDVHVVDEHPRYHLADCPWLAGRTSVALPVDEARTDGFTPCAVCAPDHGLAELERSRRAAQGPPRGAS